MFVSFETTFVAGRVGDLVFLKGKRPLNYIFGQYTGAILIYSIYQQGSDNVNSLDAENIKRGLSNICDRFMSPSSDCAGQHVRNTPSVA